jgi:disulfide bond formation protein DsbB
MSLNDHIGPVKETDIRRAKTFYDILCWGGLLIVLLPVGIANVVLGYIMGDSPCTLCWGQRQNMAYIGVVALFIVRYGFKPKYIGTLLAMAAAGLWMSFRHLSNHAARDLGQGFGLDVFGLHTQMWAEIVFWCAVMLFGLALLFAPRVDALLAEMREKPWRPLSTFYKIAFGVVAAVIASNTFQALWSTGYPPYYGQGKPVRFSFDPKYIVWSTDGWKGMWSSFSVLGPHDVAAPDYPYAPNAKALGITFSHDAAAAPIPVSGSLKIAQARRIEGIAKPLSTLSMVRGQYFVASKYDFWVLGEDLRPVVTAAIDPWYSANVLDIAGFTAYRDDAFVIMGRNKSLILARLNPKADDVREWANFTAGRTQVEHLGSHGRERIDTVRADLSYILSSATDGRYVYTATVPDNRNHKRFVISKALMSDWMLSGEFVPSAQLKNGRSLGELYVTGMAWDGGKLWCVSKNFNLLFAIDVAKETVESAWALPSELTDIRGLVKKGNAFEVLDGNRLVTLTME